MTHKLESIRSYLRENAHIDLSLDWLQKKLEDLNTKNPTILNNSDEQMSWALFQHCLNSNLCNCVDTGSLPNESNKLNNQICQGIKLLQVQDIVDISQPAERRQLDSEEYKDDEDSKTSAKSKSEVKHRRRTLKLALTDGKQLINGIEYQYCEGLSSIKSGSKIALKDPLFVRGIVLIQPSNLKVVGGGISI